MTIKDIARMANVSIGTVDRVIHKRGRVSEETKDRILGIIMTLHRSA
ncbi:MAG: LacI family DNA-binding transcriptional regulator [Spirochaetales bacterium]|nr:LacI family DNA-binding transcriptional regulator [Spirochaetales bacterium]